MEENAKNMPYTKSQTSLESARGDCQILSGRVSTLKVFLTKSCDVGASRAQATGVVSQQLAKPVAIPAAFLGAPRIAELEQAEAAALYLAHSKNLQYSFEALTVFQSLTNHTNVKF